MNAIDNAKHLCRMEQSNDGDYKKWVSEHLARACRAIANHPERYVPDGFFTGDYSHEIVIRVPIRVGAIATVETNVESFVVDN